MDGAALIKEHQDDLRTTTRTITTRGANYIEVGGGIFEQLQLSVNYLCFVSFKQSVNTNNKSFIVL
jgi:hypothetical protein